MFSASLYLAALLLLVLSWRRSPQKTLTALKKAGRSCLNILPLFLGILICMGLLLAFVGEDSINAVIGRDSGILGILLSGVAGSILLVPAFAAYPAASELLRVTGAYAQITMLITTLMLVGIATIPLESKFFGLKATLLRNGMGLVYSFALALFMGILFGEM